MGSRAARNLALALAAIALALSPAEPVTLGPGSPWWHRLAHPFSHVAVWHAALNAWSLLAVCFALPVTPRRMLAAYAIAALFPAGTLSSAPVCGLSGVIFALLGSFLLQLRKPWRALLWLAPPLLSGLALPGIAGACHLWCFALGLLISLLNLQIHER